MIGLPYFYPGPEKCPGGTDVWCEIANTSAVFEDTLILASRLLCIEFCRCWSVVTRRCAVRVQAEAQRRLQLAVELQRPFFLAVGFRKHAMLLFIELGGANPPRARAL